MLISVLFFSPIVCSNVTYELSSYGNCMSFPVLLDGVWLSINKKITYLLTYLLTDPNNSYEGITGAKGMRLISQRGKKVQRYPIAFSEVASL